MAAFVVCLVLLLAMTGRSSAVYCVCRDGVADAALQRNIDYACGAGADCSAILQNGACYNPNTVRDHCNYAVNSYFQRRGQAQGSCDFQGTATQTQTVANQPSGCVYQASPSSTTPSTNTTTPTTGTPPSTGTGTPPGSTTPGSTTPSSTTPVFGLAPTGTGITNTDSRASVTIHQSALLSYTFTLTLLFSGLMC